MAATASFQKSRRCLSPGKPSGLISWMTIIPMMTSARIFDMQRLSRRAGRCQSSISDQVGRLSVVDQCSTGPPAFFQAAMPPSIWQAEPMPASCAAVTAIAERSPKAQKKASFCMAPS